MAIKTRYVIEGENQTDRLFATLHKDIERVDGSMQKVRSLGVSVGAAVAAAFGGAKLIETLRDFGKLQSSLVTVTGSSKAAEEAFAWIEEFAAKTPFSLQEVVGAFIKLEALGLKPSEAALRSYGNTAAAMGKSLDQFVEAVADATTGEFERLKEFGIKASSEGNRVSFTFRGITTTVAKESEAIAAYLENIGNVEFGGAMERQAATLDGALSNLGDSVSRLIRAIGDAGLTEVVQGAAGAMSQLATSMADSVKEGDGLLRILDGLAQGIFELYRGSDTKRLGELMNEEMALDERIANLSKSLARSDLLTSERVRLTKALTELQKEREAIKREIDGLKVVMNPDQYGAAPVNPTVETAKPVTGSGTGLDADAQKEFERQAKAEAKRIEQFTKDIDQLQREFAREQEEVNQDIARNNDELNRKLRDNQQDRVKSLEADLRSETEVIEQEYQERLQLLRVAEAKGLQTTRDYAELRRMVDEDRARQLKELHDREAKDFENTQKKMFEDLTRAVEGWGNDAAAALVDFATGGKATIGDFVDSVLRDFARMLAKKALIDPLFEILTNAVKGAGGGGSESGEGGKGFLSAVGSFFGNVFGGLQGSRAGGGPVVAGMPYLWREPGREGEVFVPSTSGTVQNGGGVNVQVVVNNQTASQVNVTRQNAIDSRDGLERLVVDIVDSRLSDGTFDRTMGASYGARRNGVRR